MDVFQVITKVFLENRSAFAPKWVYAITANAEKRKTVMKKLIEIALVIFSAAVAGAENSYQFVPIAVPGSVPYSTSPSAINNNEVIAGYYQDSTDMGWHGFTYNTKEETWVYPIDDPNALPGSTYVTTINDSEVVGGFYLTGPTTSLGFTKSSGVFSDWPVDCYSQLTGRLAGINNTGIGVGNCTVSFVSTETFSWVWTHNKFTVFTCPSNATNSGATAINNHGEVVGWYDIGSSQSGYISSYSTCGTTVSYPGAVYTVLTGISDAGVAIGWVFPTNGIDFGFFYNISSGLFSQIPSPTVAKNGLVTQGMNNGGWFVGYYLDKNYNINGFFAKPRG
jgi:hypothetical protein